MLFEDQNYQTPTVDSLNEYAVEHGIGYPLLIDLNHDIWNRFERDGYMPSFTVFSKGMVVEATDAAITEQDVLDWMGI